MEEVGGVMGKFSVVKIGRRFAWGNAFTFS